LLITYDLLHTAPPLGGGGHSTELCRLSVPADLVSSEGKVLETSHPFDIFHVSYATGDTTFEQKGQPSRVKVTVFE